ncbi:MAG: glycerol-3-phosphate 1-O-acyltransferase PlsY [Pseudomonadota bacterium]
MLDVIFKLALAYVLGSIMGSLLLGRYRGVDIRMSGSGNAGGTNALRTQGKGFALGVMVIDVGKGWLAAAVVPALTFVSDMPPPVWLAYACGAAAVIGHVFPLFYGFRGGKGAATLVGTLLCYAPVLVLPLLVVFILTIMLTGYVGLATIVTTEAAMIAVAAVYQLDRLPLLIYAAVMSIVIIWTHRSNIMRMMNGTESRNTKMMVLRRQ